MLRRTKMTFIKSTVFNARIVIYGHVPVPVPATPVPVAFTVIDTVFVGSAASDTVTVAGGVNAPEGTTRRMVTVDPAPGNAVTLVLSETAL